VSRRRRVYHPALADSVPELVTLTAEESHHVQRVLRLRAGDPLVLFDGAGSEWDGSVETLGASGVEVRLGGARESAVELAIDIRLYQGLCRYDRVEWVLQKATELGARSVHVVTLSRSEVPPPPKNRQERWQRLIIEASKQSGRTRVPELELIEGLPAGGTRPGSDSIVFDVSPGANALGPHPSSPKPSEIRLAVGPEGGFSAEEVEAAKTGGWRPAGLGPRTLRTETAGIVAVALATHIWGDFRAC
jgi:16S rRNA (uracil1498-N3)-methyltransferase